MEDHTFRKMTVVLLITIFALSLGVDIFVAKDYEKQIVILEESYRDKMSSMKEKYDSEISSLLGKIGTTKEELKGSISDVVEKVKEGEEKRGELKEEIKGLSIEAGDFSAVVNDAIKGVVTILTDKSQASGTIVSRDGYIVTNHHVIEGISGLAVFLHDKSRHAAKLIGFDKANDIAVLKIEKENLYDLDFTNSDKIKIGEKVVALGNPKGLEFSVTQGIISQKGRIVQQGMEGLIQTDVAINPGNSGGPLLNKHGDVVGIVNSKIEGYEGLGFAIPSNVVWPKVQELMAS